MRICTKCVLPENFPGVRFTSDGVYSLCLDYKGEKDLGEKKLRYREEFEKLVKKYRGRGGYDA